MATIGGGRTRAAGRGTFGSGSAAGSALADGDGCGGFASASSTWTGGLSSSFTS
jgi:hypothetical protein